MKNLNNAPTPAQNLTSPAKMENASPEHGCAIKKTIAVTTATN